MHDVTVTYGCQ